MADQRTNSPLCSVMHYLYDYVDYDVLMGLVRRQGGGVTRGVGGGISLS